jgi:hypothetical protein
MLLQLSFDVGHVSTFENRSDMLSSLSDYFAETDNPDGERESMAQTIDCAEHNPGRMIADADGSDFIVWLPTVLEHAPTPTAPLPAGLARRVQEGIDGTADPTDVLSEVSLALEL